MKAPLAIPVPHIPPGAPCDEFTFMEALRRALSSPGRSTRLARQNCGQVALRDRSGRQRGVFNAGPMVGASDLSGIASVVVPTPTGSPVTIGLRLDVECKGAKTPHTDEQVAYEAAVNRMGGVALVCRYDAKVSLAENVHRCVAEVDRAVAERVAPLMVAPKIAA